MVKAKFNFRLNIRPLGPNWKLTKRCDSPPNQQSSNSPCVAALLDKNIWKPVHNGSAPPSESLVAMCRRCETDLPLDNEQPGLIKMCECRKCMANSDTATELSPKPSTVYFVDMDLPLATMRKKKKRKKVMKKPKKVPVKKDAEEDSDVSAKKSITERESRQNLVRKAWEESVKKSKEESVKRSKENSIRSSSEEQVKSKDGSVVDDARLSAIYLQKAKTSESRDVGMKNKKTDMFLCDTSPPVLKAPPPSLHLSTCSEPISRPKTVKEKLTEIMADSKIDSVIGNNVESVVAIIRPPNDLKDVQNLTKSDNNSVSNACEFSRTEDFKSSISKRSFAKSFSIRKIEEMFNSSENNMWLVLALIVMFVFVYRSSAEHHTCNYE